MVTACEELRLQLGWLGKELCREVFVPALQLLAQTSFASLGSLYS